MNRQDLEKIYEEQTGLSARNGSARIDIMEKTIKANGLSKNQFRLIDNPDEINNGWRNGRRWSQGKQIDNMVCLGYTKKGTRKDNCRSAIFMVID